VPELDIAPCESPRGVPYVADTLLLASEENVNFSIDAIAALDVFPPPTYPATPELDRLLA